MISFTINPPKLSPIAAALAAFPSEFQKAMTKAVSRTTRSARAAAARKVAERYFISSGAVKKSIVVKIYGLKGQLSSVGRRPGLHKFKINPTRRLTPQPKEGVFAQVLRGSGGEYLKRGFLMNRAAGVYEREGSKRLPIERKTGPAIPEMLSAPPVSKYIIQKIEQRLGVEIDSAAQAVAGGYL